MGKEVSYEWMSDKSSWKFLDDPKHRKGKTKEKKLDENFEIGVVSGTYPYLEVCSPRFSDAIASPSIYPCQSVSQSVSDGFRFGDSYHIFKLVSIL